MNIFFLIICIVVIIRLLCYNNTKFIGGNVNKISDMRCLPYIKKKYVSPWLNSFMEYDYRSKCLK